MVVASFGAMQFLPELVRAIDNDWLLFAESRPDPPLSIAVAQSTVMRMLDAIAARRSLRQCQRQHARQARRRRSTTPERRSSTCRRCRRLLQPRGPSTNAAKATSDGVGAVSAGDALRLLRTCAQRLMSALTPIVVDSARDRVARGELSFDDLLVLTRRLLRSKPDVPRRGPCPPPLPVRRRVPRHRSGAVRHPHRADLARCLPARQRRCSPSAIRSSRSTASATPTSACSPACSPPMAPTPS